MRRTLVSLAALLACLAFAFAWEGSRLPVWLHPLPGILLIVTLPMLMAVLAVFPGPSLAQALRDAHEPPSDPRSLQDSRHVWRFAERTSYLSGTLYLVGSLIVMLQYLDAPLTPWILGGKLGACLVGLFLGLIQALVARILRARVERHLALVTLR